MELLNFNEFKANFTASEAKLDDYLSYLEAQKAEIYDLMSMPIPLDGEIMDELKGNLSFIEKLEEIIKGNQRAIVIQSIDNLSLEGLQSLYDNKLDEYNSEKNTIEELLVENEDKIEDAMHVYQTKLLNCGYDKKYYEASDTLVFFDRPESLFDYVRMIISDQEFDEEILKEDLSKAIRLENDKLDKNVLTSMIDGIVNLFSKCNKLNKMVSGKLDHIVNSLLSEDGIRKIFSEGFKEDLTDRIFLNMQNVNKENTLFFQGLPESVQEMLLTEKFCGPCYQGLNAYYFSLRTDDIYVPFESEDLKRLYDEKATLEEDLKLVSNKIEVEEQFIQDQDKLKEFLKSQVTIDDTNVPTIAKLDSFVSSAQGGKEKNLERINYIDQTVGYNNELISRIEEILQYPEYSEQEDDQDNELLQSSEIMDIYVDVEAARLDQIKIMVDAQRTLETLEKGIKELKNSKVKNILSRSHKQELSRLERKYSEVILDTYDRLKDEGILTVEAPQKFSFDGDGQLMPTNFRNKEPKNFDDLTYTSHIFWNIEDYMDEILSCGLATKEDIEKTVTIQKHCVNRLFNYSKDEDGYYQFTIDDQEREYLLQCQENIVFLARALYQARVEREQLPEGSNAKYLRPEIVAALEEMHIVDSSKEALQRSVFDLARENESLTYEKETLVASFENAMIDGIDNIDDAIKYRDMLIGLKDYCIDTEEIKKSLR